MLETIRDDKGEIRAVCEWYIVDSQGHFDVSGGMFGLNNLNFLIQLMVMGTDI